MPAWLAPALTAVFFLHLLAFARLAWRRRQAYYGLVTALFAALTASFALRWLAPDTTALGQPLHLLLRWLSWGLAAVTIPMLVVRLRRRRRA